MSKNDRKARGARKFAGKNNKARPSDKDGKDAGEASPPPPPPFAPFLNNYLPATPPAPSASSATVSEAADGPAPAEGAAAPLAAAEPIKSAEPVKPVKPAQSVEPIKPAQSVEPDKPDARLPPEVLQTMSAGGGGLRPPEGWMKEVESAFAPAESWFPESSTDYAAAGVRADQPGVPPAGTDAGAPAEGSRPEGETAEDTEVEEVEAAALLPADKRLHIVMLTAEIAPAAKVGGLADMVVGLGRALEKRGHRVEIVVPMYQGLRHECIENLEECYSELWVPHGAQWLKEKVYTGKVSGLRTFFVTAGLYTLRPNIYGYPDDLRRFTYFTRAAMEFVFKSGRRPHILHAHDWQVALAPVMLYDIYEKLGWNQTRAVFTIHNNECQGVTADAGGVLGLVGLDWRAYMRPDKMLDPPNRINFMRGAINYSNFVTTVSPTYAGELKTPLGGRGLQEILTRHSAKVGGVINGIDYDIWNPATDPWLAARYSRGDGFVDKYRNKYALREQVGLVDCWKPIVSVVTRLTGQKGLDLIRAAVGMVPAMEAQFVLLGSAPDPRVDADFRRMAAEYGPHPDVCLWMGHNEDLSHLIYAGSDMLLVPSLYEPCGLTQLISMRYGTVPVVRRTGGLADTVIDVDTSGRGVAEATGFIFDAPSADAMGASLHRAIRMWYEQPKSFERLALNGMRRDFSWRHPAQDYENIYNYIKA